MTSTETARAFAERMKELFADSTPFRTGQYRFVVLGPDDRFVVKLGMEDRQEIELVGCEPVAYEGFHVVVVHNGKKVFLPRRVLGREATELEVLAAMAE